jgi:hypothetical protein
MPFPAFPPLPDLLATDTVTAIRNDWTRNPRGGARTPAKSTVLGVFRCVVEPADADDGTDGFDVALERMTNVARFTVTFTAPAVPTGGLKPRDTLLWTDEAGTGRVLTVTRYWGLGGGTGVFYASAVERK